jgi:hypothetical protein
MFADKMAPDIPDEVIESLARTLLPAIRKYLRARKGGESLRRGWMKRKKEIRESH